MLCSIVSLFQDGRVESRYSEEGNLSNVLLSREESAELKRLHEK